jgi:hypothetical protein
VKESGGALIDYNCHFKEFEELFLFILCGFLSFPDMNTLVNINASQATGL